MSSSTPRLVNRRLRRLTAAAVVAALTGGLIVTGSSIGAAAVPLAPAAGTVVPTAAELRCIDGSGPVRVSSLTPFSTWGAANLVDGVLVSEPASLGWHSGLGVYTDDAGECAIVDRGASTAIDSVTLYRADPGSPYPNGLGFPVDYHLDISDDADFGTFSTVATVTDAPIPSSGSVTHTLAGAPAARYVRLVVTKTREIYSGQYAVALAELAISGATELPGLESWYAALDEKDTRRVNVLVIGDSISESTWNPIADRYMNLLQDRINEEYSLPHAEFSYVPSYYATPAAPVDASVSWAGTLAPVNFGLGLRATQTDSTGNSTFTFSGTRARVVFTQAPTSAIARIVVDGGSPVTVDTSAGSIVESGLVWDSGALSAGSHSITVSRDTSSISGRNLWLDGAYIENGDEDSGVHFLDSAHNGYSTTQFSANILAFRKAVARAAEVSGGIDLIIWALGTNDCSTGVTTADFKARINSYVSAFQTDFGFDGAQLFLAPPKSSVFSQATWDPYLTAMQELATTNGGGFVDLGALMPQSGEPGSSGLYYDSVHPTPDGYARMTDILGPILDPESYWFE